MPENSETKNSNNNPKRSPNGRQANNGSRPTKNSRQAQEKRRRKDAFSRKAAAVIVFLVFYTLMILFVFGMVFYSFHHSSNNVDLYSVKILYDEKMLYELPAKEVNNEYGLYVPFSYLTEICSFGMAGDGDDISLFIIGTDNRIDCKKNSSLIVINDNPIRISAPILYRDNEYLIPMVLLDNYIKGIDISYDEDKKICTLSSSRGQSGLSLKLLLPDEMKKAYFPDSYKEYNTSEENSEVSD